MGIFKEEKSSFDMERDNFSDDSTDSLLMQKTMKKTSKFNSWILTLLISALFMNLFIIAILLVAKSADKDGGNTEQDYFLYKDGVQRHPETVERVYWDYDDDFLNFNVTESQEHWRNLFPVGEGMIGLSESEVSRLNLHHSIRGLSDRNRHIYLVAAFHQLHCLSQARSIVMRLFQHPEYTIPEPTYHHTMHCIDVVRQALLCSSDSTLIWKEKDVKWPGDGGTRTCRNFDALTQWTIENHYDSKYYDRTFLHDHLED